MDWIGGLGLLLAGAYMVYYQARFIEQLLTGDATHLPLLVGLAALVITAVVARVLTAKELNTA